jgi:sortase A
MSRVAHPDRVRRRMRWAERAFLAAGVLAFGYCLGVYVNARLFQAREAREFRQEIRKNQQVRKKKTAPATPQKPAARASLPDGAVVGRLEIPRLHLAVMVVEGTDERDLKRAAGHIPGTALPGEPGNVGIAAHRDTFFRPLREIQPHDKITLDTLEGKYDYRVLSTEIVSPDDVRVLYPTGRDSLTLVTCFPFYYVGSAPKRFIVRAERITGTATPVGG